MSSTIRETKYTAEYRSNSGGCEAFIYDERGNAHGYVLSLGRIKWEARLRTKIKARRHISWLHKAEQGIFTRVYRNRAGSGWIGESHVELPNNGESTVTFPGLWRWSTALKMGAENRWHLRILRKGGLL